jgi:hypothetical protein
MMGAFLAPTYEFDRAAQRIKPKFGKTPNTEYFAGGLK